MKLFDRIGSNRFKKTALAVFAAFLMALTADNAFADIKNILEAYTVDSKGSRVKQDTFSIEEVGPDGAAPWLYLKVQPQPGYFFKYYSGWELPDGSLEYERYSEWTQALHYSEWIGPSGIESSVGSKSETTAFNEYWFSLGQKWDNLDNSRLVGIWSIEVADWALLNPPPGYYGGGAEKIIHFTVTPEPVSSALFLIGGAALGISRRRKKSL